MRKPATFTSVVLKMDALIVGGDCGGGGGGGHGCYVVAVSVELRSPVCLTEAVDGGMVDTRYWQHDRPPQQHGEDTQHQQQQPLVETFGERSDHSEHQHSHSRGSHSDETHVLHLVESREDHYQDFNHLDTHGGLRLPGPLVHGEGGGEGLQQDVVEQEGEVAVDQNEDGDHGRQLPGVRDHLVVLSIRLCKVGREESRRWR